MLTIIRKSGLYSKEEISMMEYAWISLRNDAIKILLICLLAYLTKTLKPCIFIMISFFSLRVFGGGLHRETFLGCLLSTMLWMAVGVVMFLLLIHYSLFVAGCFLGVIGLGLSVSLGPIVSDKKKKITEEERKRRKWIIAGIGGLLLIVPVCLPAKQVFGMSIYIGVFLEGIQILISKIKH